MPADANAIFEDELARRGVAFERQDDDIYRLRRDGWTITANLANVRRNAERDNDADAVRRFADEVLSAFPPSHPDWETASRLLLFSAEPVDQEFGDSIRSAVTGQVARVLTLRNAELTRVTWVTPKMCADWGVTEEQATAAARANQDGLLRGITIETMGDGDDLVGTLPLASPYKASVIFADAFKGFVERALGWPVLAVIPCRDFIFIVKDGSPLIGKMGGVVVQEFRQSGYPITTEVLRISDEGIEAIGHFPA